MYNATLYRTWYEFKKDLEKELGCSLFNQDWLEAKPRAPLPWDGSDMKSSLSAVAGLRKRADHRSMT